MTGCPVFQMSIVQISGFLDVRLSRFPVFTRILGKRFYGYQVFQEFCFPDVHYSDFWFSGCLVFQRSSFPGVHHPDFWFSRCTVFWIHGFLDFQTLLEVQFSRCSLFKFLVFWMSSFPVFQFSRYPLSRFLVF